MKSWSDEWKSARLHLRLRGSQLFHGETVTLSVCVEAPPVDNAPASSAGNYSPVRAIDGPEAKAAQLQRWQDRCSGATVDVKVVVDESSSRRRDGSSTAPSSTPRHANRQVLFHQQAELSVAQQDDGDAGNERFFLLLRAQVELKVRSEHWGRPLALIARVTPREAASDDYASLLLGTEPLGDPVESGAALSDEWLDTQLLPLIREDSTPHVSLTRRLECPVTVVKPLLVQVETRALPSRRAAVVVKAHNTREDLALEVLDLQLHLSDSPSGLVQGSGASGGTRTRRYVLADDAKAPFPVSLLAEERYNFLFLLEPTEAPIRGHEAADNLPGAGLSGRSQAAVLAGDEGPEHALLTLTWRTSDAAARAVTEQHTIVWSPFALALNQTPPPSEWSAPRAEWSHLIIPQGSAAKSKPADTSSIAFVALEHDSPLFVALVPPTTPPRIGQVSTACVAITNRSPSATFDLTLVLPCDPRARPPQPGVSPSWVSFEASHHLGLVRPGKSVRKSVHFVPLRPGASLDAVVLVDSHSRTCFRASLPASGW